MKNLQSKSIRTRLVSLSPLFAACAAGALFTACGGGDDPPVAAAPAPAPAPAALTCDNSMITAFKPDANTTVTLVKSFKKGDPLVLSGTPSVPAPATATNDVCLVKLMVGPGNPGPAGVRSTSPGIGMEIWLPSATNWNGRIHALGQGGWAGVPAIASTTVLSNTAIIQWAMVEGAIGAVNDGGHQDPDAQTTGSFAMLPDGTINTTLWTDLSKRSMHELALKTKALAQAYYLTAASRSYLEGCSGGGRQGYGEAQNFPDDFDGIVAGAPSIDQTRFFAANLYPQIVVRQDLGGVPISNAQNALVSGAAVSACDSAVNGQHDGFISDPATCRYDPTKDSNVLCVPDGGSNATAACVSIVQARAFNKFWYGPTTNGAAPDPAADNGINLFPSPGQIWYGPMRGTDMTQTAGTVPWVRGPDQVALNMQNSSFGAPNFINATGNGTNRWMSMTYAEFSNMLLQGAALNSHFGDIDTHSPDITAFRDSGGKMITYHGLSDRLVAPSSTINYYTRSSNFVGGLTQAQSFHRLFFVPGMGHCAGIGSANGTASPVANPPLLDTSLGVPQMYGALTDWVEKGIAPTSIRLSNGDNSMTRPICTYPAKATYVSGDVKAATSYVCK